MKFRGHLLGGAAAGAVVTGIAVQAGVVYISASTPTNLIETIFSGDGGVLAAGGLFLLTVVMALFPDLDTASVPQRWFFRIAFVVLLVLLLLRQMDLFAGITFILFAPVLHRHRGWTHAKVTPFAISVLMILLLGYFRVPNMLHRISLDLLLELFHDYWIVILACVAGHYTHLALDSR